MFRLVTLKNKSTNKVSVDWARAKFKRFPGKTRLLVAVKCLGLRVRLGFNGARGWHFRAAFYVRFAIFAK